MTALRASAALLLCPRLAAAADRTDISALYRRATVIDSLCSPFADAESDPSPALVKAVLASGITAVNWTVSERDFEGTLRTIAGVQALVDHYPDAFTIIRRQPEIALAKQSGRMGILMGFQYTGFLEDDPSRIGMFRNLDVRIMQLTYNNRSIFGDGCLESGNAGLSNAGHSAVATMNAIGVAVDMSHSGYRTTSEAIEVSSKPVLISHSGCAAVYAHPRNKPDAILRALADRGGYFGVYLMPYLVASPTVPTHEHVLNHLVHAIDVCGADHVGVGCDGSIQAITLTPEQKAAFDADIARRKQLHIGAPGEDRYPWVPDLSGPSHMEEIAEGLARRGQPASVIEKVLGANFQRVLGDIWRTA
ncbi:MAG TPA: membrane dipeptidase [Acidobacteriaceae bacterium]|nr:membrane dipeptidase [Acidobacteriaceae bacterium]